VSLRRVTPRAAFGPSAHRRAWRRCSAALCGLVLLTALPAAYSHPLGNDSVTHFNVLYILPDRLEVDFLLDLAENPSAFIESSEMDTNQDGQVSREEQEAWLEARVQQYPDLLEVQVNGEDVKLQLVPERVDPQTGRRLTVSKVIVPMLGPMGMTYRLVIRYVAAYPQPLAPGEHVIAYEDKTYPQHVGLKLVLLEPTPQLCRLFDADFESLMPGPLPEWVSKALADEGVPLADPSAARIEAMPAQGAIPRVRLLDGSTQFALLRKGSDIDVLALPYCELLEPHPPFVSEDHAAFRYEQYDPMNLPDVRRAKVRFRLHPRQDDAEIAAAPAPDSRPAVASISPDAPAVLPGHATSFLDPTYNPVQMGDYERQARKMIGLLQGKWGVMLFLIVTGTAFVWGAAHALMPGHAKTVVAAYLISQRGTYWHALMLAIIVTVTHTALVIVMGLIIWFYQQSNPRLAPKVQLWLGLLAGLLVVGMGLALAWRALTGRLAHHHDHHHHHGQADTRSWWRKLFTHSHPHLPDRIHMHDHEHGHDHGHDHAHDHAHVHGHAHEHPHDDAHRHDHDHAHPHAHAAHAHPHEHAHVHVRHEHGHDPGHTHAHRHPHGHGQGHTHSHTHPAAGAAARGTSDQLSFRMLLMLGITGGIVPCPSATIIMFMGIGANVVGGALYAIAVFSLGLALALMLIGSLALASRRYAAKIMSDARHEHELSGSGRRLLLQIVPTLSGLVVTGLGSMIVWHYLCLMRNVPTPFPWMG